MAGKKPAEIAFGGQSDRHRAARRGKNYSGGDSVVVVASVGWGSGRAIAGKIIYAVLTGEK